MRTHSSLVGANEKSFSDSFNLIYSFPSDGQETQAGVNVASPDGHRCSMPLSPRTLEQ